MVNVVQLCVFCDLLCLAAVLFTVYIHVHNKEKPGAEMERNYRKTRTIVEKALE